MIEISESLRQVMRGWPTGVAVVTSTFAGFSHGMTINSLASVSLDPPLVTLSLANQTRTCKLVQESGCFAVTMLAAGQAHLSDIFSGKIPEDQDRFTGIEIFTLETGAPLLKEGRAFLDCRVQQTIPLPNSTLFLGRVVAAAGNADLLPLIYLNRGFKELKE